jgi:hypothetical protein
MPNKQENLRAVHEKFEAKFAKKQYITPTELESILERERELDERALDNNAPGAMPSPWHKPLLSHEEYMWLQKNHPEYTEAYEKEMSPCEKKITGAIMITGAIAFYGGIGYGIYNLFLK